MVVRDVSGLLAVLFGLTWFLAGEVALARTLPEGQCLFEVGRSDCPAALADLEKHTRVEMGDGVYLAIEPDRDPYAKVQWEATFPAALLGSDEGYTLEIVFYDKGACVIQPSLRLGDDALPLGRRQSYTRLNTLEERSAYFAFRTPQRQPTPDTEVRLAVAGLQYLRSIRLLPALTGDEWAAVTRAVPKEVRPMVVLERPMDLVVTAGVPSKGVDLDLQRDLDALDELVPLAKVLGFNAIELYVRWNLIEPEREGRFDFSYYDALVAKIQAYGLKWFPLLIVGSAYALPEWFVESEENVGFVCLEHGISNPIQSIWSPYHRRHVSRVLRAFGDHYDRTGTLQGVRLGPSGNYGESQYPAGGNWSARGRPLHIHIGLWAGDQYARAEFRGCMARQYGAIDTLNQAWGSDFPSFDDIPATLPVTMLSKRRRIDFNQWYTRSMSDWCAWWAQEAAQAMPNTSIYQSAGGCGFLEAGTSYTEQAEAMAALGGGIRLTNETDSFEQNFYATRLAATAARLYGVDLGYEPASSHTARGVAGRIFNTTTTDADHFFTYGNNIFYHPMAIDRWLTYARLLDTRQPPVVDVAVYYPETMNQLEDATFRHLYAWGFNPRARAIRRVVEVDYLDEKLIREGFLGRYKVLVFVWGNTIEGDVQRVIDDWMKRGGTVFYPSFPKGLLQTVEGDGSVFQRWSLGDTGQGAFHRFHGDMEPSSLYAEFVAKRLRALDGLDPWTQAVLAMDLPDQLFVSIQQDGHLLALNYDDEAHTLDLAGGAPLLVPSYGIIRHAL